jgi:hypothetical protein
MKRTVSAKKSSRRGASSASSNRQYVLCRTNRGYEVSLEPMKIYRLLPDTKGSEVGFIRVVDESGEDYLYPSEMFVKVPASLARAIAS